MLAKRFPTSNTHRKQLAARLLGIRGADAKQALPELARMLKLPLRRRRSTMILLDARIEYQSGPRSNKPYAEAILRIDPTGAEAAEAHAYLIEHGDPYQQGKSLRALREFGESAVSATEALVRLAGDPVADVSLRYEAITSLGMIGPAAKDAIPTLEKLTEHADPQIAERAKAALRQVRDT